MGSTDEQSRHTFLTGPQLTAMLRAMFPQAAFLPKERSIHATVNLRSLQIVSEVDTLIDSGATENFISPAVVEHFSIPTRPLGKPIDIRNVDGTEQERQSHQCCRSCSPISMQDPYADLLHCKSRQRPYDPRNAIPSR